MDSPLEARLSGPGRPLVLDGATGTELERAGLETGLPLWSTHALLERPEAISRIHRDYLRAGAELITANTFRTQRRTLDRAGLGGESDRELTRLAVALAARTIADVETAPGAGQNGERGEARWIAGSLPPLEDCYAPERVPAERELTAEHARQADLLAEAGVDLILVETMNSVREAEAAARAARATGLPFLVGFVSWEAGRLLSGDSLEEAAARVRDLGARAVGVNCVPPRALPASLECLLRSGSALLVSPNLGEPNDETGFSRAEDIAPDAYLDPLRPWLDTPELRVVGGCCGTTPAHIATLARFIHTLESSQ